MITQETDDSPDERFIKLNHVMRNIAIRVDHLAKHYPLGATAGHNATRERLASAMESLVKKRSGTEDKTRTF